MTEGEKRVCAEQEGMTDAVCCGLDATAEGGDFWGAAYYKLLAGGARPALSVFAVCDERESSPPLFAMRKSDKEVLFSLFVVVLFLLLFCVDRHQHPLCAASSCAAPLRSALLAARAR